MRKFECPFCDYVKIFYGKEAKKFRKRVSGFTCPRCGKKITDDDIKRKKGKGPKPKGERRKRVKKEVVKEIPKAIVPQPYAEQFEWKTRTPSHTNPWERRNPNSGIRNRSNYLRQRVEKPLQPVDRSLGEAAMGSLGITPSAPIPYQNFGNEEKLKNSEVLKVDMERLEQHEKKLALMIVRLDRVEERMDERVKELDLKLTEFDSKLQAFSTLTSHMEEIIQRVRR